MCDVLWNFTDWSSFVLFQSHPKRVLPGISTYWGSQACFLCVAPAMKCKLCHLASLDPTASWKRLINVGDRDPSLSESNRSETPHHCAPSRKIWSRQFLSDILPSQWIPDEISSGAFPSAASRDDSNRILRCRFCHNHEIETHVKVLRETCLGLSLAQKEDGPESARLIAICPMPSAGSLGRWVAESLSRWVAESLSRWVAMHQYSTLCQPMNPNWPRQFCHALRICLRIRLRNSRHSQNDRKG
jgi:hypothetical protein